MGIDINEFTKLNNQWNELSRKLEECREQLLFLSEGTYQTENANWIVDSDGSIIAQPIIERFNQTELFNDDET